jgi:hypothetical protein
MSTDTRGKTLGYRAAVVEGSDRTLEKLLRAALQRLKLAHERLYYPANDGLNARIINGVTTTRGLWCGDYLSYEKGKAAQLLKVEPQATELPVSQMPSHRIGAELEFLDSSLLWGVHGNNVVLLQSSALRAADLERYINWLVAQAGVNPDGKITLEHRPKMALTKRIGTARIKKAGIKLPIFRKEAALSKEGKAKYNFSRTVAAEILEDLIGKDRMKKMGLDAAAYANLQLELKVSFARTTDEAGEAVLRGIAQVMGHMETVDADEMELDIEGLGKVRGSEFRLETPVSLRCTNGIVHPHEAFVAMSEWMNHLLETDLAPK